MPTRIAIVLLISLASTLSLRGEPSGSTKPVDLARDVYPIFQRACLECHGPELQKGKLRLDVRESAFKRAIAPGKADESELYRRVTLPQGDRRRHAGPRPSRSTRPRPT